MKRYIIVYIFESEFNIDQVEASSILEAYDVWMQRHMTHDEVVQVSLMR